MSSPRGRIKIEVWKFEIGNCYVVRNLENSNESFLPLDDEPDSLWTEIDEIIKSKNRKAHYKLLRAVANMQLDALFDYKENSKLIKTYTVVE